ncbi:hypothetical protein FOA43_003617 [Brettanomyces nanus]|uniref:Phosphoribulokinase/uridine kinase domain-containing protein n=1 Tax=Eeniella nana TaxID=13502 RepID=A0A875S3G9_EENNA|nr:uncharacterized protein FOA43_003617 [Brettanomyces nanus]QPG76231.1 hypothetical protein FOA43_003617 [Brettanomyces nanus]
MSAPIIIGLSGASSSGKTTVANFLKKLFPNSDIIHEDDFYYPDEKVPFNQEIQDRDWDCPEAINFEDFVVVVDKLKHNIPIDKRKSIHLEKTNISNHVKTKVSISPELHDILVGKIEHALGDRKVFLIDGFLMFQNETLRKLMDIRLFFRTDFSTLKHRRSSREYSIDSGVWMDPPFYFEKRVWPQYYKYHHSLFVDGSDEDLIKRTGGTLNEYAKDTLGIDGFRNDDNSNLNVLLQKVVDTILNRIEREQI